MTKFEDRLLSDLLTEHGPALETAEPPARRRRMSRPALLIGGAVLATGAVLAGTLLTGGGTPAYAVTRNADGTVTLSIMDVSGVDPANAELERLGLPVRAVPMKVGCTDKFEIATEYFDIVSPTDNPWSAEMRDTGGSVTMKLTKIVPGVTLLVSATTEPDGRVRAVGFSAPVKGRLPTCVPAPDPPN